MREATAASEQEAETALGDSMRSESSLMRFKSFSEGPREAWGGLAEDQDDNYSEPDDDEEDLELAPPDDEDGWD